PCRRATVLAGEIAGLNVVDIINEPTAATLAWAWMKGQLGGGSNSRPRTILLYDLGGGTFDVTVVRYTPTDFRVLGTDGDTFLGGLDWTNRLVDYVATRFQRKYKIDPRENPATRYALTCYCERAKQTLSEKPRSGVQVVAGGHRMTVGISQQEFEELTADLVQRTRDTTELVLEFCGISASDLDDVVLVGGSTSLPAVKDMLEDLFGRPPCTDLDPRLAVAQGAAIHAAILEAGQAGRKSRMGQAIIERLKSIRTTDVNSHSLGVVITDPSNPRRERNHIMIPRNSTLPAESRQRFVTTVGSPSGIRIRLLEGEASDVLACTAIGDIRITELPENLPAGSPVEVLYRYDDRRCIQVSARELTGASEASVRIVWEGMASEDATTRFRRLARDYHVE
ncbi:MAG: Hsp70 family protein, partial [Planctomycetaceae bacterium]|nr:Hsp70 family protein [Planctomycetaceae bacterium]